MTDVKGRASPASTGTRGRKTAADIFQKVMKSIGDRGHAAGAIGSGGARDHSHNPIRGDAATIAMG